MGALTLCLGSSYRVLHLVKQSCPKLPVARSFSSQNPLPSQGFLFSHSYSLTLIPKYSQKNRRIAHQCSLSAAWPYESWDETIHDDGEETEDYSSWPRIVTSELDGGFEVLAMGFGVAVSVALAASRSIPPSGLPVAALTLAFLVTAITTLRFQIGRLWRKLKEIVGVATNHRFRSLAYQFGVNKVASNHVERITDVAHKGEMTSKDKESIQLLSIRNSVQTMHNGAAIGISQPSNYHLEIPPSPTSLSSTGEENQVKKDVNDANKSPAVGPDVEVVISDMAKCVAQLAVVVARLEEKITNLETKNAQNSVASSPLKQATSTDGNGSSTFVVTSETVENRNAQKPADSFIRKSSIVDASPLQQADSSTNGNISSTFAVTMENVENGDAQKPADLVIRDGNNLSTLAITVENVENSPLDISPLGRVNMVAATPWTGVFSESGEENWVLEPLRKPSLEVESMAHQGKLISILNVEYKEKSSVSARSLELQATTSDAGWNEYPVSSSSTGNGRQGDYNDETKYQVGAARRGQQRTRAADDEETSYDGSRRRAGPADNWDGPSSSRGDPGEKWRQVGTDITDVDFGGNGSSGEDSEGGRRQWGKGSTRSSDMNDEAGGDSGTDVPAPQETGPSARNNPSYPLEQSETYRNLAVLKKQSPDDDRFQRILDEVEALLNEGREGLEGRIEVGVAEQMLYEASDLCAKAVALRPSSLVGLGLWGNTLLLHGELKLRLTQNLRSMLPEPSSSALNRRDDWEAEEERQALEATIQEVSEECEQLLVEAGRKYRSALSVDRTDMRALYNWGLALCYRGQLIAEEGGETSFQDADKVYLAAIDKFEAMMGLSDKYACGALLNWGLAMRDRSRLRPMGSKERIKLMVQAREIFQEALRLDPNYGQARGAVAACNVELRELQEYEEPRETRGLPNWWGR